MICAVSQACNFILPFLSFSLPGPHNSFPCFMRVQTPRETFRRITCPACHGGSEEPTRQPKEPCRTWVKSYLNEILNISTARVMLNLSSQTFPKTPRVKLSTCTSCVRCFWYLFFPLNIFFWPTSAGCCQKGSHWFKIRKHPLTVLRVSGKINQAFLTWLVYLRRYSYTQLGLMSQHVGWSLGRERWCPPGETKQTLSASFTVLPKCDHTHTHFLSYILTHLQYKHRGKLFELNHIKSYSHPRYT